MKIKSILWLIALILILVIVSGRQEEQEERVKDGTYQNCYMLSLREERMEVLIDDTVWTLSCPLGKDVVKEKKIVDIEVENNKVSKITWKEGLVTDQALAVDSKAGWIKLKSRGKVNLSEDIGIYLVEEDSVKRMEEAGSLLNWEEISLYILEEKVHAIVAEGKGAAETMKVLLHGTKDGIYHKEVRVTASENYTVESKSGKKTCQAGEEFGLNEENGEWEISCETGKIRLLSGTKNTEYPEYRGKLYISSEEAGYIVVNELPLEEYLYSVVSSEMPSSYPEEALKAQAVCARTYAIYQMQQSYYSSYGAHVDDTVNSQVYNNVAETSESKKAVTDTKGEYLTFEKEPIPAYFYSTSSGTTSDVTDVWISTRKTPVYLEGKLQEEEGKQEKLSDEERFRQFVDEPDAELFEVEEAWFRWETEISKETLAEYLNENMDSWEKEKPAYYDFDGGESLGTIEKAEVITRSSGGVIKELKVTGTEGSVSITGEYQIRRALCPSDTEIILQDGSKKSPSMLPSGYFYVEMEEDCIRIVGGGYGHGVGLSQNGAKAMAEKGYGYKEILTFYYPETEVWNRY